MITEVDSALLKGNFGVKGWVRTGDKVSIKFLSYYYHAERDTFSVKPNVNWSPKRRGARLAPNVENVEDLKKHVEMYPLSRRNLASILMGTLYDPLQIYEPYQNNLKLIYRDLTRQLHAQGAGPQWDTPVSDVIKDRVMHALSFFFLLETIEFPRKVLFMNAEQIHIWIYFDGFNQAMGVSVVIQNVLPTGQVISRLLCNK